MDARIKDILKSLLGTSRVLDEELLRLVRSEVFTANAECLQWMAEIEQSCLSTLDVIEMLRQKLAGNAFVIPPDVMATLE